MKVLHKVCGSVWGLVVGLLHPRHLERYYSNAVEVPKEVCGPTGDSYGTAVGQWFCKNW